MFLLYYIVNLINYVFYVNILYFNKLYLSFNKFNLVFKKSFDKITFFEKFILVLFHNNNWFFKSISNFSNYTDELKTFKKKNYPLLNFFSFYNLLSNTNFKSLFFLKKNYLFFKKNKFLNSNKFIDFVVLQLILSKKYFSFLNKNFFFDTKENNLVKLNYLFLFFNKTNFKNKGYKLNLNYYNDWFIYLFNNSNYIFKKIDLDKTFFNNKRIEKINYMTKIIKTYTKNYNFIDLKNYKKNNFYKNILFFMVDSFKHLNVVFFKKIIFNKLKFKYLYSNLPIRFSESSVNKYINSYNLPNYTFFYLRKNKIFNKSRYSRNRQLYRTGVYWCLWLNIMIVYGLYFFFYRFTFNFGYIWIGLCIMAFSTIFSRILKYKFYNIYYLVIEFNKLFSWFNSLFNNFYYNLNIFLKKININGDINLILFSKLNNLFYFFYKAQKSFLNSLNKKKDYGFVYVWKNYSSVDKSFLKYKSILNWFTQLYKVLTY